MQLLTIIAQNQNNSPVDPSSPMEVAIFIVLPVLLIVVYFIARGRRNR